jgi:hypothetical protein
LILCASEASLAEPLPSKWAATYDEASGRCELDDTLPDQSDPKAGAQSPAAIDFFGGRNGLQMLIGGHDFLDATPEPTQITLKVDDRADGWSFNAIPNTVGLPTISLADDDRTKALFVAVGARQVIAPRRRKPERATRLRTRPGIHVGRDGGMASLRRIASAPK